jgi:hypothetical protein
MRGCVAFAFGALLVGCGSLQYRIGGRVVKLPLADETVREGKAVRRVGSMWSLSGDTSELIAVPTAMRAGERATVVVEVSGGGCLGSDTTAVHMDGMVATIVPYQRVFMPRRPNGACTANLVIERRSVSIAFLMPGTARIRVVYRAGESAPLSMTERAIIVH